ncbi:LacI family DNA-binding transcriptional regulator [Rhizobium lemnae]|uniref:LacI family DNA-binding transcriptional regulator n=1 Tax=Rhizobium lemnae TaxID=1214924 RepID=A0ABV8ED75_9HYPH|nr:LacI family DNA-binding transcriptional regulator [Rhizobium lemnae]MCJ8507458.1 LacI family DNA-binding transcriptional regulator [Rhizobium lemnae]
MAEKNGTDEIELPRFISAHEVAQRAGVSRSAVSRTFTHGASVSSATREKVIRAAEELGYQVNDLARGLLANRSQLIGMIASDAETPFRSQQIAALSRLLIESGRVPVLITTDQTEAGRASHATLLRYRAEATIILSGMPSKAFVDLAQRNGQPLIAIGRSEVGPDHIRINNALAAETAVGLFAARGMRHIGLITSSVGSPNLVEREEAYTRKARDLGLEVHVERAERTNYDGGTLAASLLLTKERKIEGVFCVNDLMAFGLMDYARDVLGLAIPADLSVIGLDDVPEARWGAYRLTTFQQNAERQAREILQVLEQRLKEPTAPPIVSQLDLPLVVRKTVRPLPAEIPEFSKGNQAE